MFRVLLMVSLSIVSGGVTAEWLEVERSDIQTTYADSERDRSKANRVKMSLLSDYKNAGRYDGKSFLSVVAQYEFNCKDSQSQMLSYVLYAGHMGEGAAIYSNSNTSKWKQVSPDSQDGELLNMACGK